MVREAFLDASTSPSLRSFGVAQHDKMETVIFGQTVPLPDFVLDSGGEEMVNLSISFPVGEISS